MEQLTAKVNDQLKERFDQYRRRQDEIPKKSEVIRAALDEFLPELEDVQEPEP